MIGLLLAVSGYAETFRLADGGTVTGEPINFTAADVLVRVEGNNYERIPWDRLSQETLKELRGHPRAGEFVEPFIELTPTEEAEMTGQVVKPVERLPRPDDGSLFGMIATPIGGFLLLLIIGASAYAGYEVAFFRNRPPGLVCGISAVAPILGPIIFLALPSREVSLEELGLVSRSHEEPEETAPDEEEPYVEVAPEPVAADTAAASALPPSTTFRRGQITFNRRFFETRFAGFLRPVPEDEFQDMVIDITWTRGKHTGHHIRSINQNDLVFQADKGGASTDETIPFVEITEVVMRHKDARA
jgi:hypothetical protein